MKTRLRLKAEVKLTLVAIVMLIICFIALDKTNNEFLKDCQGNGYSQNYCERHG